jgi:hypothetical protein
MAPKSTAMSTKSSKQDGRGKQGGWGLLTIVSAARSPIKFLRRNSFTRGVLGGHNGWTAVAVLLWMLRHLRQFFGKKPEVLSTEKLKGGQFVRVDSLKPQTRRQIKQADRAQRAAVKQAKTDAKAAKLAARATKAAKSQAKKAARSIAGSAAA